nr:SDR family oxidoreductase [Lacticaseibacillus manihotivorans]
MGASASRQLNECFYAESSGVTDHGAEGGGAIVNITSAAAVTPHPNAAPSYGASKADLTYLTKHLAQEFAEDHIRVNAVCCGPIASAMTDQWHADYREKVLAKIPLKRLGTPEEVAAAVAFLLSEKAGFCTGASLNVSGGKLMI